MKLINQSFKIVTMTPDIVQLIEQAGRTCYKSEAKITDHSAIKFVKGLIKSGHNSVLEHGNVTVKIISNRSVQC